MNARRSRDSSPVRRVRKIDVAHAWDEEDVNYIQSREKFRWFIETFLPSMGYETTLDEEQHLSS